MKLTIDNLDNRGPRDYTPWIDGTQKPRLIRRLNKPSELRVNLVAASPDFVVPVNGARVMLGRANGQDVFTGYVVESPSYEYLGWSGYGPVYRYKVVARSDEVLLDVKTVRRRYPFVGRSVGDALRQLTEDLLPGAFDTTAVEDVDQLTSFLCDPQKTWSQHAAELGLLGRGSYRVIDGKISFTPLGKTAYRIHESDPKFAASGLVLESPDRLVNDVTVIGHIEPQSYVKDYFVADGLTTKFYLSQTPYLKSNRTLLNEEYASLDPTRWVVADPRAVIAVTNGSLVISGGSGQDGETTLRFSDEVELGGALILQHGDFTFTQASDGVVGGLYSGSIVRGNCVAGFQVSTTGTQSLIQPLINGYLAGTAISTQAGRRYVLTTRIYAAQVYRQRQLFHSSQHGAGEGLGGEQTAGALRFVLEVHEIDPANAATLVAPTNVLYDGVLGGAPALCVYALVNAKAIFCNVAFTYMTLAVDAEVRSALPGLSYRTRLAGALADGADCRISTEPALQFYPQSMPAKDEQITVHYRGTGRALARISDPASITAQQRGLDNGVCSTVRNVRLPVPRTAEECEQAALAILDDGITRSWSGVYTTWSDCLPDNAADVFPGDSMEVSVPSRDADFTATVREVDIEIRDLQGEDALYAIKFADDAASPVAIEFQEGRISASLDLVATSRSQVGTNFLPDLTAAEITATSSTTVTIDAGVAPLAAGGIEVRRTDTGWGATNDRNLLGRFSTQAFTLSRLSRVQDFFLRQYDNSTPAKYSRRSAALHLDYPL